MTAPPEPFAGSAPEAMTSRIASGVAPTPQQTVGSAFTFIDLFAGIGGIRLGLERANGRCVYSVEIDPHARVTYESNFGPLDHDDVRTVLERPLPIYDVLAAGFPCQPFSIAGVSKKNALGRPHGFEDAVSGNLFFSIRDVVRATRPPVVLLENVKNLLTHDGGRTYHVIESEIRSLGYTVRSEVIDSSPWVPQRRKRTFIVALSHELFGEDRFEFPTPATAETPTTVGDILEDAPDARYTLTRQLWDYLQGYAVKHHRAGNGFGFGVIRDRAAITRTLSARYYKDGSEILIQLDPSERPRRLTPIECGRLMGFPDPHYVDGREAWARPTPPLQSFRIPVSDWRAYKQFGNSVVVPVVEHIGRAVAAKLTEERSIRST